MCCSLDHYFIIYHDWPLHPAAEVETSLTVGACWHGNDQTMRHSLQGYLAGLSVLVGRREHSEVLKCLVQCSESLQLPATNLLEPGMKMVTIDDQTGPARVQQGD